MYIFIKIINCNNNTNTYSKSHDHSTRSLVQLEFFCILRVLFFNFSYFFQFTIYFFFFCFILLFERVSVSHRSLIFNLTSHILKHYLHGTLQMSRQAKVAVSIVHSAVVVVVVDVATISLNCSLWCCKHSCRAIQCAKMSSLFLSASFVRSLSLQICQYRKFIYLYI